MEQDQQNNTTNAQTQNSSQETKGLAVDQIDWFRRYWVFGIIFLFLPFGAIIGLILLFTGEIYKQSKLDKLYYPIKQSEKVTLTVVAIIFQIISYGRFLMNT